MSVEPSAQEFGQEVGAQGVPAWGTPQPGSRFVVLVEQHTGSGQDLRWMIEPQPTRAYPAREPARVAALEVARTLQPKHPFSKRARRIFLVGPDEFVVMVVGATKNFHFRVSVAEEIV